MTPDEITVLAGALSQSPTPPLSNYAPAILTSLLDRRDTMASAFERLAADVGPLSRAAERLVSALATGHKALVAGNGGSAAEAQHFAAELVGRFKRERAAYAAIALTTDTSVLTAVANDYGYNEVFSRQIAGLGSAGDVFVAFSTSGESSNLIRACRTARQMHISTIAVIGSRPCALARLADVALAAPLADTATIQELHMAMTHILCDIVESELSSREGVRH